MRKRRGIAWVLVGLCMMLAVPAIAESSEVPLMFASFGELGFGLLVPEHWEQKDMLPLLALDETDQAEMGFVPDLFMAYGDPETNWQLHVMCFKTQVPDAAAIAELEADFGNNGAWDVASGYPAFVFISRSDDICGAYVQLPDMLLCISGKSAADANFVILLDQVLSSIAEVEAN